MAHMTPQDWNQHYVDGELPWDSGVPSKELIRVLDAGSIKPGRAAELGCGTGTNAIYLASRGFDVTGFDFSSAAVTAARQKAADAKAKVNFLEADLCRFTLDVPPFDFVFDRGCYHAARRIDQPGFIKTLKRLTRPGTRFLLLSGQRERKRPHGPTDDDRRRNLQRAGAGVRDPVPPRIPLRGPRAARRLFGLVVLDDATS